MFGDGVAVVHPGATDAKVGFMLIAVHHLINNSLLLLLMLSLANNTATAPYLV